MTKSKYHGPTNPPVSPPPTYPQANEYDQRLLDLRNQIVTMFAGAHIKAGVCRRQRRHSRQHAHHRSNAWATKVGSAAAPANDKLPAAFLTALSDCPRLFPTFCREIRLASSRIIAAIASNRCSAI
jgi:hypothetical protein